MRADGILRRLKNFGRTKLGPLILFLGLLGRFLTGGSRATSALQEPAATPRKAPEAVNYRRPAREYRQVRVGDMKVAVERQLQDEDPQLAEKAIERLKAMRSQTLAALPTKASKQLGKLSFFLMFGPKARGGGRNNGLEYFQKNAPEFRPELDRRWGDAIVIYSAQNYVRISDLWAQKALLHEFAHAYQLEQWPEHQPDIQSAWEHARDSGLYRNVRDVETGKTIKEAYALTNQLEYFAELSCMYFAKCNYEPSDRGELKTYDPVGYAMIRKLWRIPN